MVKKVKEKIPQAQEELNLNNLESTIKNRTLEFRRFNISF
jgi:hypothetical protein